MTMDGTKLYLLTDGVVSVNMFVYSVYVVQVEYVKKGSVVGLQLYMRRWAMFAWGCHAWGFNGSESRCMEQDTYGTCLS